MTILDTNRTGIIYGLSDSRTPEYIRYIGFTTTPLRRRLCDHRNDKDVNHRTKWVKSVFNSGGNLHGVVIDEGSINELPDLEKKYILLFKSMGAYLVNGNNGGIGCHGYRWSVEQKLKVKGRVRSGFTGKTYEEIYGKERAEIIRKKVGEKSIGRIQKGFGKGRKMTKEQIIRHSLIRQGLYHNNPHIIVQYKDGIKLAEFKSTLEASRATGVSNGAIKVNCRGYVMRHYRKGLTKQIVGSVRGFVFKRELKTDK